MLTDKVSREQGAIDLLYRLIKDEINKQLPCIVKTVNADGTVDCLVIRNDEITDSVAANIPIKHLETQRAYVFLGIKAGDKGVIRFFDKSVENYKIDGNTEYNGDDRQHDISDGLFELGFLPKSDAYAFPTGKEIVIGLKDDSAKIDFAGGAINISTTSECKISTNMAEIEAQQVNIISPVTNLGVGGLPIARAGDPVVGLDNTTVIGSILSGGVNTSI